MPNDPAFLSPDARMHEVAAILAQGVLRLGNLAGGMVHACVTMILKSGQ